MIMTDDYLWDGSGEPDPEVQRLERLLGRFRSKRSEGAVPDFDAAAGAPQREPADAPESAAAITTPTAVEHPRGVRRLVPYLAAAAALAVAVAGLWLLPRRNGAPVLPVTRIDGAPLAGSRPVTGSGTLRVGEWLETDASSRALVAVGDIGEVEVDPRTRLQLVAARPAEHRLALARGTIHALIWAPPRQFFVETPSAVAVDLGCAYTLEVDEDGSGVLRVTLGWVGFEAAGRESFIPADAMCLTRPDAGPGTPHYEDASPRFRSAVERIDFADLPAEARARELDALLGEARPRDAFTLWHLLSRLNGVERVRVFERMAELVPPPAGVTRRGVLDGDREMLESWWDVLGLGDTEWWRVWKLPEPPG